MANVTFWKGTLAKYQEKVQAGLVEGRLYFIEDAANPTTMGALYLKDQLISPQRLTALALDTVDNVSSVTAKAVVDFVKANFDAKGAYDQAISGIEGRLDAVEAILAGYGEGGIATVKEDIEAVKAIASAALDFKGVVASEDALPTEGMTNGDVYYVTADSSEYVYIDVEGKQGWEKLGGVVDYTVFAEKAVVEAYTVNGKKISSNPVLVAADIEDVYSKTEVDGAIDADVAAAKAIIDAYTVGGVVISANPTLESMGVNSAIATAKGEAIEAAAEAAEAMTVNGVAFTDGAAVITAGDIMTEAGGTTTVSAELGRLDDAIKAITGEGEEGDATTIAGLAVKVNTLEGEMDAVEGRLDVVEPKVTTLEGEMDAVQAVLDGFGGEEQPAVVKTYVDEELAKKVDLDTYNGKIEDIEAYTVNGKAINTNPVLVAADIEDVYSKTEVDNAISAAALVWVEE